MSTSGIIDSRPETVKAASALFGNKYIIFFWNSGVSQMHTCVQVDNVPEFQPVNLV